MIRFGVIGVGRNGKAIMCEKPVSLSVAKIEDRKALTVS